jgi:hypothetical protein
MSLILVPIFLFAVLLVIYGVLLFRVRYRRIRRQAEDNLNEAFARIVTAAKEHPVNTREHGESQSTAENDPDINV